ncbi:MAG: Fic family protein, partial [Caulobacteraceae bacterium]|nr:Fic family protein [Caulobacteraceae bacterium]
MTERRHSVSEEASSEHDPVRRAELEAKNGLRQFDYGMQLVEDALSRGGDFRLRVSHIQALHREALIGISPYAGNWRPASIAIQGSAHEPLPAHLVAETMEDLCDYINARWETATPIHLSAYAMWKLNWIHPFTDGNGRTSRIVSYIVLCIGLKS